MGQFTIYLDEQTELEARAAAQAAGLSLSKWVTLRIQRHARTQWPAGGSPAVRELAGAWTDFPAATALRKTRGKDVPRDKP